MNLVQEFYDKSLSASVRVYSIPKIASFGKRLETLESEYTRLIVSELPPEVELGKDLESDDLPFEHFEVVLRNSESWVDSSEVALEWLVSQWSEIFQRIKKLAFAEYLSAWEECEDCFNTGDPQKDQLLFPEPLIESSVIDILRLTTIHLIPSVSS